MRSRPQSAVINHVVLAGLNLVLATALGVAVRSLVGGLIAGEDQGDARWIVGALAAVLALLFWLTATAALRRLTLLFRHPTLNLSPDGIFVRCYRHGWRVWFLPWFPWVERRIAWTDFRGCRVERVMLYDVLPVRKSLVIESIGPDIEITWGMFQPGVERLQTDILDYHQLEVVKPAAESARVPDFLRLLFRTPRVFSARRLGRTEVAGTAIVLPAVGVLFCLHFAQYGLATAIGAYVVLATAAVAIGVAMIARWIRATRFIQLGPHGLAVGPDAGSARLIPWDDLALVRVHAVAGSPPSSLTRLELRQRDGRAIFIRSFPEAALLAAVIDPPADLVRHSWRLIADGQDPLAAARTAGLPWI
jgi:hypothetical protein